MKTFTLSIILFFCSFITNAQTKTGDVRVINDYLSLKKTEKGYVFIDYKGNKSKEYTYVYLQNYGIVETIIVPPYDPNTIIIKPTNDRCYSGNDNSIRRDHHTFELLKELGTIDNYYFKDELTFSNIRDGLTGNYGWISQNEKYAMVTPEGNFLTEFIYDHQGWFDERESPYRFSRDRILLFNQRTEKGRKVTVIIDKFTGKEVFATKDSIVKYWNAENYLLKTAKNKYYLTYKSNENEVPKEFSYLNGLPIESSIFTNCRDRNNTFFMYENGNKIESDLIPLTNFYKGYCIVLEKSLEEQKFNYYGEPLYRKEINTVKIINEQFETVKVLETYEQRDYLESYKYRDFFNDYGQIIVYNRKESFIMDYTGAIAFKTEKPDIRIKEVYKGLYEVSDNGTLYSNFYNQKGEKLINERLLKMYRVDDFIFKEGVDGNYLTLYYHPNFKYVTLDKENNVIDSYYE